MAGRQGAQARGAGIIRRWRNRGGGAVELRLASSMVEVVVMIVRVRVCGFPLVAVIDSRLLPLRRAGRVAHPPVFFSSVAVG
jgi:hypothetical protein